MSIWHSGPHENIHLFLEKWNMTSYVNLHPAWTVPHPVQHMNISCTMQCINPLTTDNAYMRHDPCELSISLWEFIWSIKY